MTSENQRVDHDFPSAPRLLVAAKQAPVWHERVGGVLRTLLSPGGTGSVVGDLASRLQVEVVSSAATEQDIEVARANPQGTQVHAASGRPIRVRLVRHAEQTLDAARYGVVTELLWQTMHNLWDGWSSPAWDESTGRAWSSLRDLNEDLAGGLVEQARGEPAAFLVHDYQLCLAPTVLRKTHPHAPVLYFHHIAWPGPDALEILPFPVVQDLIRGLLAADVVAFFAHRWCRNFLHCVEALVPEAAVDHTSGLVTLGGRTTRVVAEPLSYSPDALAGLDRQWPDELAEWAADHPLVVHSGRSDPTKNAHRAVDSFVRACQRGASHHSRMLVRVNPHRLHLTANAEYLRLVRASVTRARDALGEDRVRLVVGNDRSLTLGALARADVVVLNSLSDGQNLTAFEAVAVGERTPAILISPTCGASELLAEGAALVNPHDLEDQAAALRDALNAPKPERARRFESLREHVTRFELPLWTSRQLTLLGIPSPARSPWQEKATAHG